MKGLSHAFLWIQGHKSLNESLSSHSYYILKDQMYHLYKFVGWFV